jgi:hypothetical protein
MSNNKVNWLEYEFTVYEPEATTWNETAGIYIFCGSNQRGQWVALYIGQPRPQLSARQHKPTGTPKLFRNGLETRPLRNMAKMIQANSSAA